MGGWAHGVMYGVKKATPADKECWDELIEDYKSGKGPKPEQGANEPSLVGFMIAYGVDRDGYAPALEDVPFDAFTKTAPYKARYEKVVAAWPKFQAWAKKEHGIDLPKPQLWIVIAEVG